VPAAAVIPAPVACADVVAVKRLTVDLPNPGLVRGAASGVGVHPSRSRQHPWGPKAGPPLFRSRSSVSAPLSLAACRARCSGFAKLCIKTRVGFNPRVHPKHGINWYRRRDEHLHWCSHSKWCRQQPFDRWHSARQGPSFPPTPTKGGSPGSLWLWWLIASLRVLHSRGLSVRVTVNNTMCSKRPTRRLNVRSMGQQSIDR